MTIFSHPRGVLTASAPDHGPVVVGHRGCGAGISPLGHRENTVASFLEAADAGARWVECDVQATSDGVLLLSHDMDPEWEISARSLVALGAHGLDALEAVHQTLPVDVGIDVELKIGLPDQTGRFPSLDLILSWVMARATERPWLITSFDPLAVLSARMRGLDAGWLTRDSWPLYEQLATTMSIGATVMAVHVSSILTPRSGGPTVAASMAAARDHGIQVLTWGTTPEQVPTLADAGVAAFCGDDIAGLVAAVQSLPVPVLAP